MDFLDVLHDKNYKVLKRKKYAKQRATQGFCDADIYSINNWFLSIIPKMIRELKKVNLGIPNYIHMQAYYDNKYKTDMTEEDFICWNDKTPEYKKFLEETSEYGAKKWNSILDEIAFLFDECDDEKCSMQNEYDIEYVDDLGRKRISDKYMAREKEIYKHKAKCKKRALKMFCKYFDDLWW